MYRNANRINAIAIAIVACLALAGLLLVAGCSSSTSANADGSVVVTLPVENGESDWSYTTNPEGVVKVTKGDVSESGVAYRIEAVGDGSVEVALTQEASGSKKTVAYTFDSKDGKLTETGHSENTNVSF